MNKWITAFLVLMVAIIIIVVTMDHISNRPGNHPPNPFEFNIDQFKAVDDTLIAYRETRQIRVGEGEPKGIAWSNGKIFLLTGKYLQMITPGGVQLSKFDVEPRAGSIAVSSTGTIYIGYDNFIVAYDSTGRENARYTAATGKAFFTGVAVSRNSVFIADAGYRLVRVLDHGLNPVSEFKGESGVSDQHGFILPGLQFHLAVNANDELWVTNPGIHALQNYSETGRLRGHWSKASFGLDGFSGCCNPSYFAFMSDDSFVTSEKGLIRVKVHHPSGELKHVVAAPESFKNGTLAPALAVDNLDNVIVLDFDRKLVRIFEQR